MLRVGIVANEVSGDQLGASLIAAIRARHPDAVFEGMTGPEMEAAGCRSLARIEPVMGLVEVLRHLRGLLRIRKGLERHFMDHPPDLFVGVDAPDFNLRLERRLKASGIPTAHFVSPTVWAWRERRVKAIREAVDLMLCIFPFEAEFLARHRVPAVFVGHPLADEIGLEDEGAAARERLDIGPGGPLIALLPGSRMSELRSLGTAFIETARWCAERRPDLRFIVPLVNPQLRAEFTRRLEASAPELALRMVDGRSRDVIRSAELVLTASGTATLEALLLGRPMVVAYRLHWLTHWLVKRFNLVKIPHFAMANLLTPEPLAPEFLQEQCRPEVLGGALLALLDDAPRRELIRATYRQTHRTMRQDAADNAAGRLLDLCARRGWRG
ncbi:MAG: lipid-A-disaccharide synthase [Candidatus Sedimenticola endophacoides]|uniref:Lipid-A-disaccharide synthase n=1 Tax=Candidatus Sedimenticola endophacoides TaxID=2548426 RepID=A0A6N4DSH7_9GAMM|nr:MAG: lipid-A-disaccharide synthase [Candidatus Sedimenticola endophacoides]OQX33813.1 MAG: lipid-A-disaccharide synthase [Candidatus Sedimenticola endophacoides]OQX40035.1 MAG: lipid-A-disaccharide synthase [Candidatus Sedimenticola endophacoides]OQX47544.1 MAG: lipid-A-disaccharide synthase [Candidatus Sedimenticola endophacoides]PUD98904.1 MAG: lipid-A-disaccharide synthase [Candidatus Sedimenticola endophacoides]